MVNNFILILGLATLIPLGLLIWLLAVVVR